MNNIWLGKLLTSLIFIFCSLLARAEMMDEYQGLKIQFDESRYKETNEIKVHDALSTFVNCGSQYAIWYQFPSAIRYTLKNLDSGKVYHSIDNELSISLSGNSIYEEYSKKPCNKIVEEKFSVSLKDIYFIDPTTKEIKNFKLYADYAGHKSSPLVFMNKPLVLKGI